MKEAVTGSFVEMEVLEFMLSADKKNGYRCRQQDESFVQCWQAVQCEYSEHLVL